MNYYRYIVYKNGEPTNAWTSEFAGPEYYEDSFGLKERWASQYECTQDEIDMALDSRFIELGNYTEYLLPAQYTVETIDITEEVKARKKIEISNQITDQYDIQIKALMTGAEFVTRLGEALAMLDMATNSDQYFSTEQVAYGKAALPNFRNLMNQIQDLRAQRDAEILTAHELIDSE